MTTKLTAEDFTNEVAFLVHELQKRKKERPEEFVFSDTIDNDELQYVDLVQEGGGVLGIALAGYTYILEEMGIRFLSLGGTSAGSINTLLLAAMGRPQEKKTLKILDAIIHKDFADFMDGGPDIQLLVKSMSWKNPFLRWLGGIAGTIANLDEAFFETGFNSGDDFYRWIKTLLKQADITTARDLKRRMNSFPKELLKACPQLRAKLAIVAADITTETKVVFPDMADLYFDRPESVSPAKFVRASMSIPLLFKPFEVNLSATQRKNPDFIRRWRTKADFLGKIPEKVSFVDGGIMSNFPIDVFHEKNHVPNRPTFGVRLGIDRIRCHPTDTMLNIFLACFDGARNIRDYEIIKNNEDFSQLISYVDIDSHNWLNFDLTDADKLDLFKRGELPLCFSAILTGRGTNGFEKISPSSRSFGIPTYSLKTRLKHCKKQGLTWIIKSGTGNGTETGKKLRILWMDSNPGNDFFEQQLLIALGFEVIMATNAGSVRMTDSDALPHLIVADFNKEREEDELNEIAQWFLNNNMQIPLILHSTKQTILSQRRPLPNIVQYVTYEPKQLLELVLNLIIAKQPLATARMLTPANGVDA